MMVIISLILIFISLAIILAIIVKKFPALAILDVHNMPGEKEAKFKNMLMKARIERDLSKWGGIIGQAFLGINKYLLKLLKLAQTNLKKAKISYKAKEKLSIDTKEKIIKDLYREAEDLIREEKFTEAEDKLVEVISLDQRHLGAFFDLGSVYEELRKFPEARQTYEYALKLAKQDGSKAVGEFSPQEIYFSLAWLEKEAGNIDAAYDNILEALELEPNSPRFLDLILDLSIIRKDKFSALRYLDKLAAANPENQKLEEIRQEIEEMPE